MPKRSSPGEGSAARLKRYRAKRDFERTREPAGRGKRAAAASPQGASRYVIHEHHARRLHWDLRLERDGVLVCWAIPNGLPETPNDNRFAVRFAFDVTNKPSGKRMKMDEIGLFTVEKGKITREEFFYPTDGMEG